MSTEISLMHNQMNKPGSTLLDERSRSLRKTIVQILATAGRAHVGSAFSLVEILRVLYDDILQYDSGNPLWDKRDRFVLSKGHGCLALYVMLVEKGFFSENELWQYCNPEGMLGGHPEIKIPGIEASTGSLGHGLPIANGFALNALIEKASYKTYVIIGDGESNEGSIWEAALFASKHNLSNLTVIIDYNKYQSYGPTSYVQDLDPLYSKWESFGFEVAEVNGHDVSSLQNLLFKIPFNKHKPSAIICHTVKGKGIDLLENNMDWHHKNKITSQEINFLLGELESS